MSKDSFIVPLWSFVLKILEKISLFYVIRNYILPNYTKGNYRFVDFWLIFHTILSIVYLFCAYSKSVPTSIKYFLLVYGALRVFEIFIYQLNVILVHPYNSNNYSLYSYRRMTISLIHNFFEIIFWFAGTYLVMHFMSNPEEAIYNSFIHMTAFSGEVEDWVTFIILQFQALIGLFMTILSFARFISLFPQPKSMDEKEQNEKDESIQNLLDKMKKINENFSNQNELAKYIDELNERIEKLEKKIGNRIKEK